MKRVLTYGEFSHITEGHVAFLRNARDLGDGLVVAINQDGLKPLSDRMDALLKTGLVDAVVPVACCRDCCGLVDKWNISIYAYGNTANKLDMLNCEAMFIDSGMLRIPFLVVVTGQGCSLRCKDCANFSPFAPADTFFYAMDGIILDLRQILRYSTINMLQVQGGEAFLHPHLDTLLRFIIENTRIDGCVIATNGTIVPDIDVSLLKHEKITVRASHYSLTDQQTEELLTYCEINGIRNSVWNFASRTGMWHDLGDGGGIMAKAEERFDHCAFRGCLTLEEHKIGRCSRSIIAESVQNFTPSSGDYLSIVDNTGFRERLQSYIAAPRHMVACHFCNGTWDSPLIEPAVQCA